MDKEDMEYALKNKLGKRELYVWMAVKLGYLDIYGIQQVTGFRRDVVESVAQNVQNYKRVNTSTNTNITLYTAQNMQTPSKQVLDYLNSRLVIHTNNYNRDLKCCKSAYMLAYDKTRNQPESIQLVKDCIDVYFDDITAAGAPAPYLLTVFTSYLRSLPTKTKDRREWEAIAQKRTFWNPIKKAYELVKR